ncbi:hypothetical protein GCM10018952_50950 [Streptosporangium vulgare]
MDEAAAEPHPDRGEPVGSGRVAVQDRVGDHLTDEQFGLYLEDAADVRRYVSVFDYLRAAALSPADTATMLMDTQNNLA